ncbi:MAG: hypothetical protein MI748_09090 [Opitutales bacterium]|nr:hypothetical protein [Opitutales bacterium]
MALRKTAKQPVISTLKDKQEEKRTKSFLEEICQRLPEKFPLGINHDHISKSIGYMENFEITKIPNYDNEWMIVADVYLEEKEDLNEALGGFSFSWTEPFMTVKENEIGCIYIPYPHYNDNDFLVSLYDDEKGISIGKWKKKEADPVLTSLIVGAFYMLITPAWTKFYDETIAPSILSLIEKCKPAEERGISFNYGQVIDHESHGKVHLHFIPNKKESLEEIHPELIKSGTQLAVDFLEDETSEVYQIKLYYHSSDLGYRLHCVQYQNGNEKYHS